MRTVTPIDAVRSITATMFLALMRRPFATREILHRQRSAMRTIRAHVSACSPRGLGMTRCQVRIQVLICSRMGKFPARPREVQPLPPVAPHHQMVHSATRVQPTPLPREALRQCDRHSPSTQVPRWLGRRSLALPSSEPSNDAIWGLAGHPRARASRHVSKSGVDPNPAPALRLPYVHNTAVLGG